MPRTHHPAATLLLTLGLALAGLTACAEEEPVPKFAEEPTAAATPVEKKETPKEFIRRWARIEREMQNTGDTTEYRAIAGTCTPCTDFANRVESIYADGGFIRTEGKKITAVRRVAGQQHLVEATIGATTYRDSAADEDQSMDGGQSRYVLTLERNKDTLLLVDIEEQG